ncbi:MAG: DUF4399 domain-containing protein [Chloroflexi bacterium]|nr:DUF4399 domain-containing protein [Chloroflexota bacterium]
MKKTVSRYLPKLLPLFLALTLVLVGCSSYQAPAAPKSPATSQPTPTQPPTQTTPATQTPAAAAPPTLEITQPAAGATLASGNVQVSVKVGNFQIVPPGGASAEGKGHIHYYLDVAIPTVVGKPAISAAGTYKATTETSLTWDNLAAGSHTLGVQLVNNDHTPLSPAVTAQVTITVSAPPEAATTTPPAATAPAAPSIKISSPASGATITGNSVQVMVAVSNFEIVPPGGAVTAGKGHVHYYLDVTIPTASGERAVTAAGTYKATTETSLTWDNLTPGTHTLGVQLVNSDHTPLSPAVTAEITITVSASASTPPPSGGVGGGAYGY